jgi:hypothetical protein
MVSNQNELSSKYSLLLSFAAGLILIGTAGTVIYWHIDRAAWFDESWVLEYAYQPTVTGGLTMAVETARPVPLGYHTLIHVVGGLGGHQIWPCRLVAAMFGVGMLVVIGLAMGRLANSYPMGFAGALVFLACPMFQRYLTEVKQFMPSAAMSVFLVFAAQWWVWSKRTAAVCAWLAAALGAILVSYGAWFAVVGSGLVIASVWLFQREWHELKRTIMVGAVPAAAAAAVYLGFARLIASDSSMQNRWADRFVPFAASFMIDLFTHFSGLIEQAWYLYELPGWVGILAALTGWGLWCKRQPVAGLSVLATFVMAVVANFFQVWPMILRVNLYLLVLLHLAIVAGAMSGLCWVKHRLCQGERDDAGSAKKSTDSQTAKSAAGSPHWTRRGLMDLSGLVLTLMLAAGVLHESLSFDFTVAEIDKLLDQVAMQAGTEDLVILDDASYFNQHQSPRPIHGKVVRCPSPAQDRVVGDYLPYIENRTTGRVWIGVGHWNSDIASNWQQLDDALSQRGRVEQYWAGKRVMLYRFTP